MTDTTIPITTRKDWTSDQEPRWCPGCGDYNILAAVQTLMPDLGVRREETVFVSGIGCAARTSTSGSSAATATCCRSAATT
jgi:2-oxoglutarate ferredoxin oxidoreductase subunit beta